MKYRPLGNSGLNVSVLSFGAWQLGDPKYWGEHDAKAGKDAVNEAIDAGINFFDTAEMYGAGNSEVVLGRILGARRKNVCIASKFWPDHSEPDSLRAACEASLKRLGTGYLDLYQVHWASRTVSFEDTFSAMERLRTEGKIRHIGVSNFGRDDLSAWMRAGGAVSNQIGYNILFRAIEHEILPECQRHDVGVFAYMPLMQGLLSGRYNSVEDIPVLRRRTRHFAGTREGTRHGEQGAEALTFDTIARIRGIA
jgi:myo-inositol catabolism protein IolS